MNTRRMRWMAAALLLVLGAGVPLSADKVKLKSGKVVEGQYMGGDSKAVRILLAERPGVGDPADRGGRRRVHPSQAAGPGPGPGPGRQRRPRPRSRRRRRWRRCPRAPV